MKRVFVSIILVLSIQILFGLSKEIDRILEDIHRQSAYFKGSFQHENIKSMAMNRDYEVGDTEVFWSWALNVMPPVWIQVPSTCRAVGEHCYIFVADDQWNLHMDQDDVDLILPYLEDYTLISDQYGAIEMDIETFGPIPDELDNDPKLIVFYSELGSFMGTMFDGYFSAYNQVTEEEAQYMNPPGHSNECEMIYMTCHPLNPTDPIRISVLAHELQHLIHWGGDINEQTWVNEGCSELAMVLFGLPDPIIDFPQQTDNSLTSWDQQFADYVKVMLFFTYLYEHYDQGDLIHDIVFESANSISGISNQLLENDIDTTFPEIFTDWITANYLDDPVYADGIYNYDLLDLPLFHSVFLHTSYPATGSGNISAWAAEYIKFVPTTNSTALDLNFNINSPVDLNLILFAPDYSVLELTTFESVTEINWNCDLFSSTESAYLVAAISNNTTSSVNYNYNADISTTGSFESDLLPEFIVRSYPNPVNFKNSPMTIILESQNREYDNLNLEIFNIKGQLIKSFDEISNEIINWEGNSNRGIEIPSGIYFYKISGAEIEINRSFIITK